MKLGLWCAAFVMLSSACGDGRSAPAPAPAVAPPKPAAPVGEPPSQAELAEITTERRRLLEANDFEAADKLCARLLTRDNPIARAEGHKCAANVLIGRGEDKGSSVMVSNDEQRLLVGGLAPSPRYSGESIPKALEQLDQAAALSPTDVSIHQGRLFVAFSYGDYERAVTALKLSLAQHPKAPAAGWLEYTRSFPRSEAVHAVEYLRVLSAKFPQDAEVATELGAWLTVAGKSAEAKVELRKALAANAQSAMAHWRLGELLEREGDRAGADAQYKASVALPGPLADERKNTYGTFTKRKQN